MDYRIKDLQGNIIGQLLGCEVSPNGLVWHGNSIVAILHTPLEGQHLVTCTVGRKEN